MPRISRKCYNANYYHVMVQGIKNEFIFNKEEFKAKYIKFLKDACEVHNVKILAYCIMSNHAHILVHVTDMNNISKVMASINTKFAIYYNKKSDRVGYVFRDRYRCENIHTRSHLENCIRYIHHNPVAAGIVTYESEYKYSSFKEFIEKSGIVDDEVISLCYENSNNYLEKLNAPCIEDDFMDVENEFGNRKYEDIEDVLYMEVFKKGITLEKLDIIELVQLGKMLLHRCNTTKKEVVEILKINRIKFTRILQKMENSEHPRAHCKK